jgi:hypothetical protein
VNRNVDQIRLAHRQLIEHYVAVLNQVSQVSFFVRREPSGKKIPIFMSLFHLGVLVELFVESHIKKKLRKLEVSYTQLSQALTTEETAEDKNDNQTWLQDTAEATAKFAQTLTSWTSVRGLISTVGPVAVGFIAASLRVDNIYQAVVAVNVGSLAVIGLILWFPFIYFCLFLSMAFAYKRQLFLLGSKPFGRSNSDRSKHRSLFRPRALLQKMRSEEQYEYPNNLYKAEDVLFVLLERGKGREFPVDIVAYVLASFVFGGIAVGLTLAAAFDGEALGFEVLGVEVPGILFTLMGLVSGSFFLLWGVFPHTCFLSKMVVKLRTSRLCRIPSRV